MHPVDPRSWKTVDAVALRFRIGSAANQLDQRRDLLGGKRPLDERHGVLVVGTSLEIEHLDGRAAGLAGLAWLGWPGLAWLAWLGLAGLAWLGWPGLAWLDHDCCSSRGAAARYRTVPAPGAALRLASGRRHLRLDGSAPTAVHGPQALINW